MAMIRKECKGDYQIGIYSVVRDKSAAGEPSGFPWRVTTNFGYYRRFRTLAAAHLELTGEPLRQPRKTT